MRGAARLRRLYPFVELRERYLNSRPWKALLDCRLQLNSGAQEAEETSVRGIASGYRAAERPLPFNC